MATKFTGTRSDVVPDASLGGSVRVTISNNVGQGNGGTSLPCKKVWLNSDGVDVRVNFGEAPTATTGIQVPQVDQANDVWDVLELDCDDVAELYFYGDTDTKVVDILYRV